MNTKQLWCKTCNSLVDVAVDHGLTALLTTLGLGAGAGLAGKKSSGEGALLGALLGLGAGLLANGAKKALCPHCSCEVA